VGTLELRYATLKNVWPKVLSEVFDKGQLVCIDGVWTLELPHVLTTIISNPLDRTLPVNCGWSERVLLECYVPQLVLDFNPGFTYSYGNRTFQQVNQIVEVLKEDCTSRHGVAVTWRPSDIDSSDPPCMILMDFKIRKGMLHLTVYYRSHDLYGAAPANIFALSVLLEKRATELNVDVGTLTIVSNKGHIYATDLEKASRVCNRTNVCEQILYEIELKS